MRTLPMLAFAAAGLLTACGPFRAQVAPDATPNPASIRLTIVPQGEIYPNRPNAMLVKLTGIQQRTVFTPKELLDPARGIHLYVIDRSLSEFRDIALQPLPTSGLYGFSFAPKPGIGYRAFADITPSITQKQEFPLADITQGKAAAIDRRETMQAQSAGYLFDLSIDKPAVEGELTPVHIEVRDGKQAPVPVKSARLVGFWDDLRTVSSVDAKTAPDRISAELPSYKPGFVRLFAEAEIGDTLVTVPFGYTVAPKSKE